MVGERVLRVEKADVFAAGTGVQVSLPVQEVPIAVVRNDVIRTAVADDRLIHRHIVGIDLDEEVSDIAVVEFIGFFLLVKQVDISTAGTFVQVLPIDFVSLILIQSPGERTFRFITPDKHYILDKRIGMCRDAWSHDKQKHQCRPEEPAEALPFHGNSPPSISSKSPKSPSRPTYK